MLNTPYQQEITSLKQDINREILKIEKVSERTIPQHICINNLKSKLERLEEIEKILSIDKYRIVFIGTIGQGKTTAICHLFNLISDFNVSRTINGKPRNVTETRSLLSTGAGRTTICEVIIKAGERTSIEIEPYTVDEMENLIFEFCESIANKDNPQSDQKTVIPKEIDRAIRNIIELKMISKTVSEGDKKKTELVDLAKDKFDELGLDGFKKLVLNNANLEARTTTRIEFEPQNNDEKLWIKDTFAAINTVQFKEFAIPRKIYVYVSDEVLSGSNLPQFDSVIDTKGLEDNPLRKDLEKYIDSEDTICLFVTPFSSAPETNILELIKYHLAFKSKDFHHRFITLVLPRKNEPEKMNDANEDRDLGIKLRQNEVQGTFRNLNLNFFSENILFYDALRYYRDDIVKINDLYTEEDVQEDKNEFIEAIAGTVERRKNILLEEIKDIQLSFIRIKNGDTLTSTEVKALENAIQNIKLVRNLNKRVPAFVYKDFINDYIKRYRIVYKAWNTKHAIHRNFGYYEPRNIDIYYDAKVVAQGGYDKNTLVEGESEDKMIRQFTKEVKQELEDILNNLTSANEYLKTFIPELVKEFNGLYDHFIDSVGNEIETELKEKLSPQTENSEFWQALIAEKGRPHAPGETYTGNICQIFKQELESGTNLNQILQKKTEYHWGRLVKKILNFFGEK